MIEEQAVQSGAMSVAGARSQGRRALASFGRVAFAAAQYGGVAMSECLDHW
jgi:hypothetical protein